MKSSEDQPAYAGILLAAGKGKRFDPTGGQNKLLQTLPSGDAVVAAAARNLQSAIQSVRIVISPESPLLAAHLRAAGYAVTECANAASGIAASLVHAVQHS